MHRYIDAGVDIPLQTDRSYCWPSCRFPGFGSRNRESTYHEPAGQRSIRRVDPPLTNRGSDHSEALSCRSPQFLPESALSY